ncbi:transient receptor potential cation channel subfamily A member 1-like protein, partial [Dinothrombium tinctorium]
INVADNDGNTALHFAIESNSVEAASLLLRKGINTSILNKSAFAAIHLATQLNRISIIQEMLKFKTKIEPMLRGKYGRTALHLASVYNHFEIAQILILNFGCSPLVTCDNGYSPIHEAARNASSNTLKIILESAVTLGYSNNELMTCHDSEGKTPLHFALHAGDIETVKLCLDYGASITCKQDDLSTPVHLVCAQGGFEIIKLMLESQPDEKIKCLSLRDAQNMTPLHYAAMFDHFRLVEYLTNQGADFDAEDKEGRSVLLLAAARGSWNTVMTLFKLGSALNQQDNCNRNIIHHIVINGGDLTQFIEMGEEFAQKFKDLLNEKDIFGFTPLHYSSRDGNLTLVRSLLELGAIINAKNNENRSPLHLAARYDRHNIVQQLLESQKGHLIVNEMDGDGLTALHIACEFGYIKTVKLLLVKGALLQKDHKGRTPLHYAALNGFKEIVEQLILVHSHLLNQTDREGNTALHLAAISNKDNVASLLLTLECKLQTNNFNLSPIDYALHYKHSQVMLAMVLHATRSKEIIKFPVHKYSILFEGLIDKMPQVMMKILDKGIEKSVEDNEDSKQYYLKYNFQSLKENGSPNNPLPIANLMVVYGKEELLCHPLTIKYLESKWDSYGLYFHLINLSIYIIFLIALTANSILLIDSLPLCAQVKNQTATNCIESSVHNEKRFDKHFTIVFVSSLIVLMYSITNIAKEIYNFYIQGQVPRFGYLFGVDSVHYVSTYVTVYIFAAVASFLAWFVCLLFLQKFNSCGLYVVMFLEILSTLIRVLFVFFVLIVAFGLSFYILMAKIESQNHKGFYSPSISMLRVSTMMLGEMDFLSTFLSSLHHTPNPLVTLVKAAIFFLVIFAILMPILLMNLLIGLAVGDIETVRRNAQMKRLTMQVHMYTDIERKLPKHLVKYVDKDCVFEYPNQCNRNSIIWSTLQNIFVKVEKDAFQNQIYKEQNSSQAFVNKSELQVVIGQNQRISDAIKTIDRQAELLKQLIQQLDLCDELDVSDSYRN